MSSRLSRITEMATFDSLTGKDPIDQGLLIFGEPLVEERGAFQRVTNRDVVILPDAGAQFGSHLTGSEAEARTDRLIQNARDQQSPPASSRLSARDTCRRGGTR